MTFVNMRRMSHHCSSASHRITAGVAPDARTFPAPCHPSRSVPYIDPCHGQVPLKGSSLGPVTMAVPEASRYSGGIPHRSAMPLCQYLHSFPSVATARAASTRDAGVDSCYDRTRRMPGLRAHRDSGGSCSTGKGPFPMMCVCMSAAQAMISCERSGRCRRRRKAYESWPYPYLRRVSF